MHYTVEENIVVIIVYYCLKIKMSILKIALNLMVKKG